MSANKVAIDLSNPKTTSQKKTDYKTAKVHPAPNEVFHQVSMYERWKNDGLDYQANKTVSSVAVEYKQVSLNTRWLDDCVG
jgi:hypothetical protein